MSKEKGPITKLWLESRKLIEEKNFEKAEETLDKGIYIIAQLTLTGKLDKDLVENVKMETWKERYWISLENNIWPLRKDYEENWKC